eukprot:Gb_02644 [translate_table: standard]
MFGNGTNHPITGKGIVSMAMPNGEVKKILNVLHAPILTKCLMSISKIVDAGMIMQFDSIGCILKNGNGDLVVRAVRDGDLYKLQVVPIDIVLKDNTDANDTFNKNYPMAALVGACKCYYIGIFEERVEFLQNKVGDLKCSSDKDSKSSMYDYKEEVAEIEFEEIIILNGFPTTPQVRTDFEHNDHEREVHEYEEK